MDSQQSLSSSAFSSSPMAYDMACDVNPVKEKKSKSKKHKKHHRHGHDIASAEDGGSGLKLKIRMSESASMPHKKKKKKDKKKKDKERKHRHHHKEKRKHHHLHDADERELSSPAAKRLALGDNRPGTPGESNSGLQHELRGNREVMQGVQSKPLYKLLDHLLPQLEKRDSKNFFAFPVTDKFAPGYSQIIKNPMDFSTMRAKLDADEYKSLREFSDDFELMCNNAMTYNTQDTVYFKTAKKLLMFGKRLMSEQKVMPLREKFAFMEQLTMNEIGFDIMGEMNDDGEDEDDEDEDAKDVSKVIEDIREVVRRPPGRFDAIPDDMSPQEIVEQAKKAAQGAAEKLRLHKPNSKLGFLRQKQDGTTSLSFLTGSEGIVPGTENERPVSLGNLIGKVKQGTGFIQGFREDRRNLAKGVHPLYYGAFSSHGPTYDSTFANLTKEETDLVYSTYGDEIGVQYAESILNFSRDSDYPKFIVDQLLDILTGNEHRKTSKYIEEQKMLREEEELMGIAFDDVKKPEKEEEEKQEESGDDKKKIDFESLRSLSEYGIDMSFLDDLKPLYEDIVSKKDPDSLLKETSKLLEELKETQIKRISQTPPQHFAHMPKPSEQEMELAEKVRQSILEMTKQLTPKDIVPMEYVRKLLGIPADKKAIKSTSEESVTAL